MLQIPIATTPNQTLSVTLNGQDCDLKIYQRDQRVYLDLTADGTEICVGNICYDRQNILQSPTDAFSGGLYFYDQIGTYDPEWSGFGDRYVLLYAYPDEELPAGFDYIQAEAEAEETVIVFVDGLSATNWEDVQYLFDGENAVEIADVPQGGAYWRLYRDRAPQWYYAHQLEWINNPNIFGGS